ncbi:MAG: NAD-dependent epimerase/dehydratase family protein [Anaerolineae bacterium]|nr:MAG: NAD-dependent epimerase/dehydratase family protein [Anaerolineae bacterium]
MRNKRVLVTGATGHIGNVLVRKLLQRGAHVRALILPGEDTISLADLDVEFVEGDVLDLPRLLEVFEGMEIVYHLAGVISILPGDDPFVWRVNVEGTRNVLAAARRAGVKRLVYTSSIHALKRVPHGTVIDESVPFDPDNPYGVYDRSKAVASLEVLRAAQEGLDAVIVCPTGVIGPYDYRRSEMGEVIRGALRNTPQLYVNGAYDFVDVRDVAEGLILAAERGRRGESYILSGQRISVRYLLETVREITGLRFPTVRIPTSLARFLTRFTPAYYRWTGKTPRFTPYSLEVLESNSLISHAKATRELGYRPRALFESLSDTVRWFLEAGRMITHRAIPSPR